MTASRAVLTPLRLLAQLATAIPLALKPASAGLWLRTGREAAS